MFSKKTLISIATVAAIVAPLVPKTVNLNITMEQPIKKERSYRSVETVCDIKTKTASDNKFLVKSSEKSLTRTKTFSILPCKFNKSKLFFIVKPSFLQGMTIVTNLCIILINMFNLIKVL